MITLKMVSLITVWGCFMGASVSVAFAKTSLGELKGHINQAEGVLTLTLAKSTSLYLPAKRGIIPRRELGQLQDEFGILWLARSAWA